MIRCHIQLYIINANEQDEPGEKHVMDVDFDHEFDENLLQDLVADDTLDPN